MSAVVLSIIDSYSGKERVVVPVIILTWLYHFACLNFTNAFKFKSIVDAVVPKFITEFDARLVAIPIVPNVIALNKFRVVAAFVVLIEGVDPVNVKPLVNGWFKKFVVEFIVQELTNVPIVKLPASNNPVPILILPVVVSPQNVTSEVAATPL